MENPANTPVSAKSSVISSFEFGFDTCDDESLSAMLAAARAFGAALLANECPRWLTFLGTCGAGKTHLAKRITTLWKKHGRSYVEPKTGATLSKRGGFISWRTVASDLRAGDYSVVRDLCEDEFVCLDDIGAEHRTPFIVAKLDEICDARLGKWTIFTANLSLRDISEVETRIASRMLRGANQVVDIETVDYALRSARQ